MSLKTIKNTIFKSLVIVFSGATVIPLVVILFYLVQKGIGAINWNLITQLPKPVGETGGGALNAIVGTLILIVIASIFSIPIGISAGIYLAENKKSRIGNLARLAVEILQGIPSIVIGIIIYIWLVKPFVGISFLPGNTVLGIILFPIIAIVKVYIWLIKPFTGFSALSGGIALGIMMLPTIVKSTEETIKLIPSSLKEASLALGATYYQTILRVVLPAAFSGVATGVILSIARVAGETAPLLFTAFGNPFLSANILKPIHSLPLLIFNYAASPYEDWHQLAWGASLLLMCWILLLNVTTKIITRKWRTQF